MNIIKKTKKIFEFPCNRYYLISILLIFVFRAVYYKNVLIAQIYPDSSSYMNYNFKALFELKFTSQRTPGYPFVIRILYYMFGEENYLVGVVLFQIAISLISLIFMYKAIAMITNRKKLSILITTFYGCSSAVIGWDTVISTESLALSATVILIYLLIKYISSLRLIFGIAATLWAFIIIWIKPSFLVYCGGLLVFFIMQYIQMKSERRKVLILIVCSLSTFVLIGVYAYYYSLIHGTFSISSQGPRHLLAACIASETYKNHPNITLVQKIQQIYSANNQSIAYDTTTPVMNLFGSNWIDIQRQVKVFCNICIKNDFWGYVRYIFNNVTENINTLYEGNYNTYFFENNTFKTIIEIQRLLFIGLKIGHVYLIGALEAIFTVCNLIKKKEIPWYHFGVAGFILLIFISVYLGTYAEFMRSSIHALPFAYLGIGLLINEIFLRKKGENTQ